MSKDKLTENLRILEEDKENSQGLLAIRPEINEKNLRRDQYQDILRSAYYGNLVGIRMEYEGIWAGERWDEVNEILTNSSDIYLSLVNLFTNKQLKNKQAKLKENLLKILNE